MPPDYSAIEEKLLREMTDGGVIAPRFHAPPAVPDHQLLRRIGGGSYGEVWLARNVVGTYRAVKVVFRERFGSARPYEREFQGMQRYEPVSRRHEGLVDVLQIGRNDDAGFFYYVMELADDAAGGPPLAPPAEEVRRTLPQPGSRHLTATATTATGSVPAEAEAPRVIVPDSYQPRTLSSEIRRSGRLPAGDCVQVFLTLTAALSTLHRCGLLHRDLKPSNIVIVGGMPKLADIGLVAEAGAEMTFVGTEGYIPPEGPGTAAADLFALGRMFYEAFTGLDRMQFPSIPGTQGNMAEVKAMLELSAVAEKACATQPEKRYQSAGEMLADLALLHSGRSVQRLRTVESRLRKARRFGLAAAAAALVSAGVVVFVQAQRRKDDQSRAELAAALAEAKLQRAIAERISAKPGSRFAVLESLKEAALSRPGDVELRTAAITALAHPDVRERGMLTLDVLGPFGMVWNADASVRALTRKDGTIKVEKTDGTLLRVLEHPRAVLFKALKRPAGNLSAISISRNGRYLLSSDDAGLQQWDLETGGIVREILKSDGTAAMDPSNGDLLVANRDGRCVLHSLAGDSPREVYQIKAWEPEMSVFSEFSAGRVAVARPRGTRIVLLDLEKAAVVQEWTVPNGESLFGLSLSPDGNKVRAGTGEASVYILDVREPDHIVVSDKPTGAVISGCFSPDSEVFFSSGWDGVTRMFETSTCRVLCTLPSGSVVVGMTADGRTLLRTDPVTPAVHLYDFAGSVCRVRMEPSGPRHTGPTFPVLNDDGSLFATGSWRGARVLHTSDGSLAAKLPGVNPVRCVVFRADGNILTGGFNGMKFWPVSQSGGALRITGDPHYMDEEAHDILHSDRAGRVIVCAGHGHLRRSLDGGPFEPLTSPAGAEPATPPGITVVSPDGRWIATCRGRKMRVWNAQTKELHWEPVHEWESVPVFSPDSRRLAGNDRNRVWVGDVESRSVLWSTPQPDGAGLHGAWSPDGRWLVMARRIHSLTAFDTVSGAVWCRIEHPDARPLSGVVFSRDGAQLIAATQVEVIQMWQLGPLRAGLKACGLDLPLPELPAGQAP